MRPTTAAVLIALAGLVSACGGSGPPTVESRFSEGTEGWTVTGDAQEGSAEPSFRTEGGNPGGHLSADDDATGGVWFWSAPERYLGDRSAYYGGTLSFDLGQSEVSSQFESPDVVLTSDTLTLQYRLPEHPGTEWTRYEVPLTAGEWQVADAEEPATEAQLRQVLSDLQELKIRGEYREGSDTGILDNVVLAP